MKTVGKFSTIVSCLLLPLAASQSIADVIYTVSNALEGRVLEDSTRILVIETVAGEYVKIEKDSIQAVEKEPREEFYFRRARFKETKGDEDAALIDYHHVIQQNPRHDRAIEKIETIEYERKKTKWEAKISEAESLRARQKFRNALASYDEVLDMEPDEPVARRVIQHMSDTHAQLAFLFYDHTYDRGAIIELARAEELNPNNAEIYYVLGKINATDQKYETARLYFERTIQLDPNHAAARENLEQVIQRTRGRL